MLAESYKVSLHGFPRIHAEEHKTFCLGMSHRHICESSMHFDRSFCLAMPVFVSHRPILRLLSLSLVPVATLGPWRLLVLSDSSRALPAATALGGPVEHEFLVSSAGE